MMPQLYRGLTVAAGPLIGLYLRRRRAAGKEDAERFGERLGHPGMARPPGPLVWLHGASVGESVALLPLIERILARRPDCHALVTSGTVTSARLMAERLPPRALHQFIPVDCPAGVRRFFDHWRPDLAIWSESEFWPNLLSEARARGVPSVLVNGRMSETSHARWRRLRGLIEPLLGGFALCLAQDEREAGRLADLGARDARAVGNLKWAAAPLPVDVQDLAALESAVAGRPLWLAASTHPGEETLCAAVHRALAPDHPGLLTLIAPRHPERGGDIAAALRADGFTVAMRSRGETPGAATDIYLCDTLGELGLIFRVAGIAFVGGSLVPHGGHNPLEPARLDCAVIHGPHMFNFGAIAARFAEAGAAETVADETGLADSLRRLLADPALRSRFAGAARALAEGEAGVLDTVMAALAPYLDALDPPADGESSRARA